MSFLEEIIKWAFSEGGFIAVYGVLATVAIIWLFRLYKKTMDRLVEYNKFMYGQAKEENEHEVEYLQQSVLAQAAVAKSLETIDEKLRKLEEVRDMVRDINNKPNANS